MTREEELDWLCRLRSEIYVYMPKEWLIPMNNALDMAISDLSENKGEWIPVTERLPETHQDVLLELRSGEMLTGFKAETEPYFYCHGADGCYVEPQNVLAWQPLPEPYKAESEVKPNDHNKV